MLEHWYHTSDISRIKKLEAAMQLMTHASATIVYGEYKIKNQYKRREKTEDSYKVERKKFIIIR